MKKKPNWPSLKLEKKLKTQGFKKIIGVDECGYGSLASFVVAAAVHIPKGFDTQGIRDSKKMTPKAREKLYDRITSNCEYGIGIASEKIIDKINVQQATFIAMKQAISGIDGVDFVLIDGKNIPNKLNINAQTVVKGDNVSTSIAAASVVGKVFRDNLMKVLHDYYPMYGWNTNFGYGTIIHREAIEEYGPCEYHRKTFRKVKEFI
jgi:ribonuclease HII